MITIVLTNRNRELITVKRCLDSLQQQSESLFELFFIDYGSNQEYLLGIEQLISEYSMVNFISCPVSGQLWNKSRAINIALKQCRTSFFFVGDVDMIFHPDFIKKLDQLKDENLATYFRVGFLSKEETKLNKDFLNSTVQFLSGIDATGMTIYPTKLLKKINGYDEFYHGWGAEDADTHIRLRNLGINIDYYDAEILILHQWHPKQYRSNQSTAAYHSNLEKINHSYLKIIQETKQTTANEKQQWGLLPDNDLYRKFEGKFDFDFDFLPELSHLTAFISQFANFKQKTVCVTIKDVDAKTRVKEFIKKCLGKKSINFLNMELVNDLILQEIVFHYRNVPYEYSFDKKRRIIKLKIYFSE